MTRAIFILSGLLLLAFFLPIQTLTVPEWPCRVIDRTGQPVPHVLVREEWKHKSFQVLNRRQTAFSDKDGFVKFPEHRVTACIWQRVLGPVWTRKHGSSAFLVAQHDGYIGWVVYDPDKAPPKELLLSHQINSNGLDSLPVTGN